MLIAALAAAFAQEPQELAIDMERFRPAMDGHGFVNTQGASSLEHLQASFTLFFNQSDDAVVMLRDGQRVLGPEPTYADGVIDQRTRADLVLAMGFRGRFSLSATLPVTLWQEGFEPVAPGPATAPIEPIPSGVGDLRFQGKAVLLPQSEQNPLGVALLGTMSVPSGSTRSFLGDGVPTFDPVVAVELSDRPVAKREHRVRMAVNLGAHLKAVDRFRGTDFGSSLTYAVAGGLHLFAPVEVGMELVGAVAGAEAALRPAELLPHVRITPIEAAHFVVGAGVGLNGGLGAPDRRLFAGFVLAPRLDPLSLDRDEDGIPNKYDACPSVPEDLDGYGDEDGCPETDNDGDGLLDEVDRCPVDAEDLDGFQDADGCPDLDDDGDGIPLPMDLCPHSPEDRDGFQDGDGCPEADNDGDGILDLVDRCPIAPEVFNGFEDTDGCPDSKRYVDSDLDGLTDDVDGCPGAPEDYDRFEDGDGCPDPDNDLDGLPDPVDRCPLEPETRNGFQDEDGCPDVKPLVEVKAAHIELGEKVFFESDRAVIRKVSHPLLDEVARVLLANPTIRLVRVEGHTDSDGGSYYNLRLSQARARSVVQYLVDRGVPRNHLQAEGFGESRPIADNRSESGKAANRRVELVIVQQGG